MVSLPIDAHLPEIVARVREARALVLVAEPGAGKTTRVPPAILRAGLLGGEHPNLVMLQPRRVAARASAVRIAEENNWSLGGEVGYHVRFDRKIGPQTRLRVLTEGILTRQLLDDPFLDGVGAVILDEFHERSLHTDVTIALLREVRQTVRPDLILIVMSATLDAEPVAQFLGGAPVVLVPGRTFPIDMSYAAQQGNMRLSERTAAAVSDSLARPFAGASKDDVLVFLPGAEEIRRTHRLLEPARQEQNLLIVPLHGSLPFEEQQRALRPARERKVILATNIAETSLTIDGVSTVIDSGFARVAGFDARRGLDRLELTRISQASATQRAGRAGRTGPGRCIRLWSEKEHRQLEPFEAPEIKRVDLCSTVLMLHAWGKPDPRAFGWYEAPEERTLAAAERLLFMLGALSSEAAGQITPLGRRMMELPVHPRLARLLVEAAGGGSLEEAACVAALLSEKDIVSRDAGPYFPRSRQAADRGDSDLRRRLILLAEAERDRFHPSLRDRGVDPVAARQTVKTRDELLRVAGRASTKSARTKSTEVDLLDMPLLAYPDRVCRRRGGDPAAGTMVGGGGVRLAPESVVWDSELFVAIDARQDERSNTREAAVKVASAVTEIQLRALFPASVRDLREAVYDEERQRVVGVTSTWYRDLLLHEEKDAQVSAIIAGKALGDALRKRGKEIFYEDEAATRLLARLDLLRRAMPEQAWPVFDDAVLGDLLAEASAGKRSLEDVRRQSLAQILKSQLLYPLDRLLDQHAPETIEVPTGNQIKIDYSSGGAPILAVRLQELFGLADTPRIAGGRVAVVLHLLGPNYRPVQITEDLRNFWATTYFQVRKDLRARYPKHSWPEDPMTAPPTARGGRRK